MADSSLFASRDFRFWQSGRFFSSFARRMQATVLAWQIYQLTKNPIALGLIGLAEAIPFVSISLWAGHAADRHEKRKIMVGADVGFFIGASVLIASTFLAHPPVLLYYGVIALSGLCTSFSMTASTAYGGTVIPTQHFPRAAAWNLGTFLGATIGGPLLGGILLSHVGLRPAFVLAAALWILSMTLTSSLTKVPPAPSNGKKESDLERIKIGLRFILSTRLIFGAMMLDMIAVLFGDAVALFPIFAEMLKAGPIGFGFLRAAPAIGGGILSICQAREAFIHPSWKTLKMTVVFFGLSMIAFALSRNLYLSAFFLALSGVADGVSVITRQSLYQALTPNHLRGRVASVSGIFISSSNEIGAFESGLVASFIGTVPSVLFGATITLLTVAALGWVFRDLDSPRAGSA